MFLGKAVLYFRKSVNTWNVSRCLLCFPCAYKSCGETPFPEMRLAIGQTTAKSHIVMTHIIRHVLYDSYIKAYKLHRNLQCKASAPRSHLTVAASMTLTKLNRALLTGERQARLRQASERIASACNKLSNAHVRLVSSDCFYGWFYANNCWSF